MRLASLSLLLFAASLALLACSGGGKENPAINADAADVAADGDLLDGSADADAALPPDTPDLAPPPDLVPDQPPPDLEPDLEPDLVPDLLPDLPPDACVPDCDGKECGPDGCGTDCGGCPMDSACQDGACVPILTPCSSTADCLPFVCENATATCVPCTDDVQCITDSLFCDETSGKCVACTDDLHCQPGFACKLFQCVEALCPEFPCPEGLQCNAPTGKCVQCFADADCPANHHCTDGTCTPPEPCKSSKDCPVTEVCDTVNGLCVQCLTNDDCPEGFKCKADLVCHEVFTCKSDKDCQPLGKVCDKVAGECVDCVTDLDCPVTSWCDQAQTCVPDVCDQAAAWPQCIGNTVAACSVNGNVLQTVTACLDGEFCADAQCKPWVCTPDSTGCLKSVSYTCNSTGSDYVEFVDCGALNAACVNALCVPIVCPPGTAWCNDPVSVVTCSADGTATSSAPCPESTYCNDKTNGCIPWACTPNSKACNGSLVMLCDMFGSGFTQVADCAANAQYCVNGDCITCDPACGTKQCGPDACGGTCGTCAAGSDCMAGYCVQHACPAECTGAGQPAFACAIDLCYPTLLQTSTVAAPKGDDINIMWGALTNYGTAGNGLAPKAGPSLALLSTGNYSDPNHNNVVPPSSSDPDWYMQGQTVHDPINGTVTVTAPPGAIGFSVDYIFMSKEWGLNQPFNDVFYMVLTAPQTTAGKAQLINYAACPNPGSYTSFSENGNPMCFICAFAGFQQNPAGQTSLAGTGYPNSTGWMRTYWHIDAGETFTLVFHIQDTGDAQYDSAVLIDNFQWLASPFANGTWKL